MEYTSLIQQFYIAYYGRPADPDGLAYWVEQLEQNNGNLTAILDAFGTSAEYESRFGELSPQEQINNLYQQIFGRSADDVGLSFYAGMLERGESSLIDLALDITNGAQGPDVTAIQKRVEVAEQFTQSLQANGLRYANDDIEAAGQVVANVTADTNVADYVQSNVQALLDSLPVAENSPQPDPEPEPASTPIDLTKGNVVFSFGENSVMQNGDSAVTISPADLNAFVDAKTELFASSAGNFGNIITLETGDDTLELVTIEFSGSSPLRDAASSVGYQDWIDLALYNGDLVTAESLELTQDEFFFGDIDIESYYGYEWPLSADGQDGDTITREDGQNFSLEIELLDSLGIANLNTYLEEMIA